MLRSLPGPIRLDLLVPDIRQPFYRAIATLDVLALIEEPPPAGTEGDSDFLRRRIRRGAKNPASTSDFSEVNGRLVAELMSRLALVVAVSREQVRRDRDGGAPRAGVHPSTI